MIPEALSRDFEERYARVRSPLPTHLYGLTVESLNQLLEDASDRDEQEKIILQLAEGNDIKSLTAVLDSNLYLEMQPDGVGSWHALTYATAHMLVDGSGNDQFAMRWMYQFGHTRTSAAKQLIHDWSAPDDTDYAVQRRLGLATIAEPFKLLRESNTSRAPFNRIMIASTGAGVITQARETAFLLRTMYPDQIPTIERQQQGGDPRVVSLATFVWHHNSLGYTHILPAFELAYGLNNPSVRETMRAGMLDMLKEDALAIEIDSKYCSHWDAMATWGGPDAGERAWRAKLHRDDHLIVELSKWTSGTALNRLEAAIALGADLQAVVDGIEFLELGVTGKARFMEVAVRENNADMVGWLISRGCDPELRTPKPTGEGTWSAAEIAMQLERDAVDGKKEKAGQVANLIRGYQAAKAARSAIEELDLSLLSP